MYVYRLQFLLKIEAGVLFYINSFAPFISSNKGIAVYNIELDSLVELRLSLSVFSLFPGEPGLAGVY